MNRKFEEIRVRIYADTDPGLKNKAEVLAAQIRTSLSDLVVGAIRFTVKQALTAKRTQKGK